MDLFMPEAFKVWPKTRRAEKSVPILSTCPLFPEAGSRDCDTIANV